MGSKNGIRIMILPWLVWFIAALFFCHQFFLRISITGMADELLHNIYINTVTLSTIAASFYYAFLIWMLPAGRLIDVYGPRKMLVFATALVLIGCVVFSMSNSAFQMDIGRVFMGAGAAFSMLGILALARYWFHEKMFPLIMGITFALGFVGAVFGAGPISEWVVDFGWRAVMWGASVISIVLFFLTLVFVKDAPRGAETVSGKFLWRDAAHALKKIFTNGQMMLAAVYGFFSYSLISIFAALWCSFWMQSLYPNHSQADSFGTSIIFIGFAAGSSILGWLSKLFGNVKQLMVVSSLICCITFGVVLYVPIPLSLMFVLLFIVGFTTSATCLSLVVAKHWVEGKICATAFGVVAIFQMMGGSWGMSLVGKILSLEDKTSLMTSSGNVYYPKLDLQHSLSFVFAFTVAAFVVACFIRKFPLEKK